MKLAGARRIALALPEAAEAPHFDYTSLWPEIMAGAVIAILPVLIIFLAFQRFFVSGVVSAGVKG